MSVLFKQILVAIHYWYDGASHGTSTCDGSTIIVSMDPTLYVIYSRRPAAIQVQSVSADLLLYAHQFLNYFVANLQD